MNKARNNTDSNQEYQYDPINEVNDFFYMDFKKYVYKNRGKINKLFKGLSPEKKKEYLERLYVKLFKSPTYRRADKDIKGKGGELHNKLKKDRVIKEAKECRKQATAFKKDRDWRQAKGRRRDERQVESNINC